MDIKYTVDKGQITKTTTLDPIIEKIDLDYFESQIRTKTEQINGFNNRKAELEAQKIDMDNRIAQTQSEIDAITAEKQSIIEKNPEVVPVEETIIPNEEIIL
jgi:chromosome segregation ATPase